MWAHIVIGFCNEPKIANISQCAAGLDAAALNFLLGGRLLFPAQIVFSSSAPSYNLMRGRGRPRTKTKKIEKYFSGLIYVISWQ